MVFVLDLEQEFCESPYTLSGISRSQLPLLQACCNLPRFLHRTMLKVISAGMCVCVLLLF